MMAALASPACWMVCSESVSSLLGNVVKSANVCAAYCGRALEQTEKKRLNENEMECKQQKILIWIEARAYFTTNDRKSLIVCVRLKRPDSRLPSAKRICIGVVGCAVSKFNFWVALKKTVKFRKKTINQIGNLHGLHVLLRSTHTTFRFLHSGWPMLVRQLRLLLLMLMMQSRCYHRWYLALGCQHQFEIRKRNENYNSV